jgi:hypothetical protein
MDARKCDQCAGARGKQDLPEARACRSSPAGRALAIVTVVNGLGSKLNTKFGSISSSLR